MPRKTRRTKKSRPNSSRDDSQHGVARLSGPAAAAVLKDDFSEPGRQALAQLEALSVLPEVLVFDLDDTLWKGDIDCTSGPPFKIQGRQVRAKAGDFVELFPVVSEIFTWISAQGLRAAVASHTSTPRWAETALAGLRATGTARSFATIASIKEMHSKKKSFHLRRIAEQARCEPESMVFFDNMHYNIVDGEKAGVTSCLTPVGMTWAKVVECLTEFDRRHGVRETKRPQVGNADD